MTDPRTATFAMQRLGLPSNIAHMLESVWTDQTRWMQLAGVTLKEGQKVTASLPQGDPWSPVSLCAVLLAPVKDIRRMGYSQRVRNASG